MKILIVDDEQLARQRIADMLTDQDPGHSILEASNGLEAIRLAEQEQPDTVLMDIRMPGMDGLESALHLAGLEPPPSVVFITAYDEHAIQAFEANAVDYLLKPVRSERLQQALEKAQLINRSRLQQLQDSRGDDTARSHLSVSSHGRVELIPVNQIACFRADQKYVSVFWNGQETLTDESLKNLEEEFCDLFIRIHRNALVSINFIKALKKTTDGGYVVRVEGIADDLSISRRHIAGVRKRLKAV